MSTIGTGPMHALRTVGAQPDRQGQTHAAERGEAGEPASTPATAEPGARAGIDVGRTALIGAGALTVGGVLGALVGLRSGNPMRGALIGAAALGSIGILTGCASTPEVERATPVPNWSPPGVLTSSERMKMWDARKAVIDTISAPAEPVAGITGMRLGAQQALLKLPSSEMHSSSVTAGSEVGASTSKARLAEGYRAMGEAHQGSVYVTDRWSSVVSAGASSRAQAYVFERTEQGQSLGRPLGTHVYAKVEDAIASINAVPLGPERYAIVQTDAGLRPFELKTEFAGTETYDDLLIERSDVQAIVTNGNVYVPSAPVYAIGSDTPVDARLFTYRGAADDVGALGTPVAEIPPAPSRDDTAVLRRAATAPDLEAPKVGTVVYGRNRDTLDINVPFSKGEPVRGYQSRQEAMHAPSSGDARMSKALWYLALEVDGNHYVQPVAASDPDEQRWVRAGRPSFRVQDAVDSAALLRWDPARDTWVETAIK